MATRRLVDRAGLAARGRAARLCAGLPEPAGEGRRAVLAGRRRRRPDARDRAGALQAPRRAGDRREQARRRCDDRRRSRGEVAARRLHAAARVADDRDQRDALPEAPVRPDRGLRADHADRPRARRARGEPRAPGEDAAGIDRVREGAAGAARLRVVGQRQRPAPLLRAARIVDGHQGQSHSLQRQRAGDHRPPRRAGDDVDSGNGRHGGPHQGGQASRARGDRRDALAAASRRADGDGIRRPGLRGLRVDGPARAQGNAGARSSTRSSAKSSRCSRCPTSRATWPPPASRSSARRPPSSADSSARRRICGRK